MAAAQCPKTGADNPATTMEQQQQKWKLEAYEIGERVWSYRLGDTFAAKDRSSSEMVLIKKIDKQTFADHDILRMTKKEAEIHRRVKHTNILHMSAFFQDDQRAYFVYEYASDYTVRNAMSKHTGSRLPSLLAAQYMSQVVDALSHCHQKDVMHMDIQPENLLLTIDGTVKIAEFGLTLQTSPQEGLATNKTYFAPEKLSENSYDYRVDLWTLGVLCYNLLVGDVPFQGDDEFEVAEKIFELQYCVPHFVGPTAKDLIQKLLKVDPEERLSLQDVQKHQFIKEGVKAKSEDSVLVDYEFGKTLKTGEFGEVVVAMHKITRNVVLIQVIHRAKVQSVTMKNIMKGELLLHKQLSYPHILRMYDVFHRGDIIFYVYENVEGSKLSIALTREENGRFTEVQTAKYVNQVSHALNYCHGKGFMHMDISPENLFVSPEGFIKIAEFGLTSQSNPQEGLANNSDYFAPEKIESGTYDKRVDYWAIGVLCYHLLVGRVPFQGNDANEVTDRILAMQYCIPTYVSAAGRDLISKLLKANPEERLTLRAVLDHSFILDGLLTGRRTEASSAQCSSVGDQSQEDGEQTQEDEEQQLKIEDIELGEVLWSRGLGDSYFSQNKIDCDLYVTLIIQKKKFQNKNMLLIGKIEITLHKQVKHPNILHQIGIDGDKTHTYMFYEYVPGDNVEGVMSNHPDGRLPNVLAVQYVSQVIDALMYCHQRGFLHMNIEPANLFLTKDGQIKIGDFGLTSKDFTGASKVGNVAYHAPEKIEDDEFDERVDLWAVGVLCYNLLVGDVPFRGEEDDEISERILALQYCIPPFVSDHARDLISKFLKIKPEERLPFPEAKIHPFIVEGLEAQRKKLTLCDYEIGCSVRKGRIGEVFLATDKLTRNIVTIQMILRERIYNHTTIMTMMKGEIKISTSLNHPLVLHMYGHFEDEERIYLVYENAVGITLSTAVKQQKHGRFNDAQTAQCINQMAYALNFCHNHDIMGMDISPENLILTAEGNIKIAEFGLTLACSPQEGLSTTTAYFAPEKLKKSTFDERADYWSIGVLCYNLLVGDAPFQGTDNNEVGDRILSGEYCIPAFVSGPGRNLISGLLKIKPEDRLNLLQVRQHPFTVEGVKNTKRLAKLGKDAGRMLLMEQMYKEESDKPSVIDYATHKWSLNDFIIGRVLGKGGFGQVYLVEEKSKGVVCALKVMFKNMLVHWRNEASMMNEIEHQTILHHPHILKMYTLFHDARRVYMILELAAGGEVASFLAKQPHSRISNMVAARFVFQTADALDYCHKNNIIHRDLKPANLLMSLSGDVKLADFGLSGMTSPTSRRKSFVGTPYYQAPEIITGKEYDYHVDVWALGVMCFEFLAGDVPFNAVEIETLRRKIRLNVFEYPAYIEHSARDFINRLMNQVEEKRISLCDIGRHPWMKKFKALDDEQRHKERMKQTEDETSEDETSEDETSVDETSEEDESSLN